MTPVMQNHEIAFFYQFHAVNGVQSSRICHTHAVCAREKVVRHLALHMVVLFDLK